MHITVNSRGQLFLMTTFEYQAACKSHKPRAQVSVPWNEKPHNPRAGFQFLTGSGVRKSLQQGRRKEKCFVFKSQTSA